MKRFKKGDYVRFVSTNGRYGGETYWEQETKNKILVISKVRDEDEYDYTIFNDIDGNKLFMSIYYDDELDSVTEDEIMAHMI